MILEQFLSYFIFLILYIPIFELIKEKIRLSKRWIKETFASKLSLSFARTGVNRLYSTT